RPNREAGPSSGGRRLNLIPPRAFCETHGGGRPVPEPPHARACLPVGAIPRVPNASSGSCVSLLARSFMALRVYNTLSRQKEPFQTVEPGKVGMYVCGPTVYKPSHIGHMVGPVIFDTVRRYLAYLGYQVTFVVNITDVDDKLIARARELNTTGKEFAERMI